VACVWECGIVGVWVGVPHASGLLTGISLLFSTNDTSVKVNTHFNFICCRG